jgi:hypothetical protein
LPPGCEPGDVRAGEGHRLSEAIVLRAQPDVTRKSERRLFESEQQSFENNHI